MENKPYVKIYENGILANPITDKYNSGKSMRKIKRGLERFVKVGDKLKGKKEFILHQFKTKRGKWNTVSIN